MYQIITSYTLNLHNDICQLNLKTEKKTPQTHHYSSPTKLHGSIKSHYAFSALIAFYILSPLQNVPTPFFPHNDISLHASKLKLKH